MHNTYALSFVFENFLKPLLKFQNGVKMLSVRNLVNLLYLTLKNRFLYKKCKCISSVFKN